MVSQSSPLNNWISNGNTCINKGVNQLMVSQSSPLNNWISNGNTCINQLMVSQSSPLNNWISNGIIIGDTVIERGGL
jgi:hypothetical protein